MQPTLALAACRMENAARTTEYRARMAQRREALDAQLVAILPTVAAMVCEIGCGHGHFLTAYAQAHPGKLCVGIDVIRERIERANRKRDRARLDNLHFLQAEAGMFLDALSPSVAIAAAYVLFPDPWPKQRHHKHRLMQGSFLSAIARRAGQGTRLYFRTDHESFFRDASAGVQAHPDWIVVQEPWPFEQLTVFQSRAPAFQSLVAARK